MKNNELKEIIPALKQVRIALAKVQNIARMVAEYREKDSGGLRPIEAGVIPMEKLELATYDILPDFKITTQVVIFLDKLLIVHSTNKGLTVTNEKKALTASSWRCPNMVWLKH